jgi:uncharacterized protein (DUF58 family)
MNALQQNREAGLGGAYLRIADLRRLKDVTFASRRFVEGGTSGLHRSRQRGQSIEFNDYRPYAPGDDLHDVDWKVYGRSDRLFIKLYEHESDMTVHLLVDGSASMGYRGLPGRSGESKYDQACRLAAAIAFLVARQRDRVAFACAHRGQAELVPPFNTLGRLAGMLRLMEGIVPSGAARLASAIDQVVRSARRRGLLILFSDLLEDEGAILKSLAAATARGHEVILFQVLHEDELELPGGGVGLFVDSETAERLRLDVEDVRAAYQAHLREFLDGWSGACRRRGMDYNLAPAPQSGYRALERYLFRRTARGV